MGDKRKLFNNDSAFKLLQKARIHLLLIPHLIFIVLSILTIFLALRFNDYKIIIIGCTSAVFVSQIYWSRMVVLWKIRVVNHQLYRSVYREAINEMLVYPESNWFNSLIIATQKERKQLQRRGFRRTL